jgi:hypothetical protein
VSVPVKEEVPVSQDSRRITLISRDPQKNTRDWDLTMSASSRIVTLDSFKLLRSTVASGVVDIDVDVERIVLDKTSSAADYLALLAALTQQFCGDVIMIRDDESAFLSATGRGGDRVLYSLSPSDLRFYLETHGLVRGRVSAGSSQPVSNVTPFKKHFAA